MPDVGQLDVGSFIYDTNSDDSAEEFNSGTIHKPFWNPHPVPRKCARRFVGVLDASTHFFDGRDGLALELYTSEKVDDPAQPSSDHQDQHDQPAQAEAQVAPPAATGRITSHNGLLRKWLAVREGWSIVPFPKEAEPIRVDL
jgi:hypothetical protein